MRTDDMICELRSVEHKLIEKPETTLRLTNWGNLCSEVRSKLEEHTEAFKIAIEELQRLGADQKVIRDIQLRM